MGGGKGSSETIGYKQYVGASMALAKLVHKILNIKIGDNQAWQGVISSEGSININAPKLYGSSGAEGGFVGTVTFQPGLPTQQPNAYLASKIGQPISASRGVSQVILEQCYIGNNPYMKDMEFLCQRIHLLDDGSTQWYDEKAEIAGFSEEASVITDTDTWDYKLGPQESNPGYENLTPPTSHFPWLADSFAFAGWSQGQGPFGHSTDGLGPYNTDWPLYNTLWLHKKINTPANKYLKLTVSAENGCVVIIDGEVVASANRDNAPIFQGQGNVSTLTIGPFTSTRTIDLYVKAFDETGAGSSDTFFHCTGSFVNASLDINPAHLIRECLTDKEFGYGYDEADIDDTVFRATADQLYNENFGVGYLWDDDSVDLDGVINKALEIIDGNLYVDRDTLKWTLTLNRNDYDPATLLELRADYEVISISDYNRPEFLDLVNVVTVNYYNSLGGNGSISASNPALFLQQGVKIGTTKNYDMCSNATLAGLLAQRELDVASSPLASCTVTATSAAKNLKRGSVFKLTSPRHNFNQSIMRVTGITRGDSTTRQIKIKCVEDRFALPQSVFVIPEDPVWVDPNQKASPAYNALAVEMPYAILITHDTQSNVDAALKTNPDAGYFGVSAARNPGGLSADVYADSGSGYEDVSKLDFCPYGELKAAIGYLDNTFTITNVEDLDELDNGTVLQIDNEIMGFDSISNGTLTGVKRGVFDTVPTTHAAGAKVFFVQNYLDGPPTEYAAGESVDVKISPNNKGGSLDLAFAPILTVDFVGRAVKPYPPGNLKLNAAAYPATISGALTVTWSHRNRQSQANIPVGTTDGDVTPPVNTRYTLQFYDASDVLIIEQQNIGAPTADVVLNYTGDVKLKLFAVDDNGASFSAHEYTFNYTPPAGTSASSIVADAYTPVDDSTIIDGGQI